MSEKKKKVRKASAEPLVTAGTTTPHMQIAERAYLIWLTKGRPIGQDTANWYEAEAQLSGEADECVSD